MSTLANHTSSLPCRVHTIEALLRTLTTPAQTPTQDLEHTKCIMKIRELTFEANTNLPDVGALELTAFKAYLTNIKCRTSKANRDLYVRHTTRITAPIEASPPQNQTSAPVIRPVTDINRPNPTRLENKSLDINTLEQEVTQQGSYLTTEDISLL